MIPTSGFTDPGEQAWMVLDSIRVSAYARAIQETVKPGDVVLDIGSGSGLLALLAAKAGAKKVYAVERTGAAELVQAHALENSFEDVIELRRTDFLDLESLPMAPDVVIGEVLGHFAPDEGQHHLYAKARTLAKPDAIFLPRRYRLLVALAGPGLLERERESLGDVEGVSMAALAQRLASRVHLIRVSPEQLLSDEERGEDYDSDAPLPEVFTASVTATRAGEISGVSVGFSADLGSMELRTGVVDPTTCWSQVYFPLSPPLRCEPGERFDVEIRPRIVMDRASYRWQVKGPSGTRTGDAMNSFVGTKEDMLRQLGLKKKGAGPRATTSLRAWATALGGGLPEQEDTLDVDALVKRLFDADRGRYPDETAARQDVLRLLRAAGCEI